MSSCRATNAKGDALERIAAELTDRGILSPRGRRWTGDRLRMMVVSDVYAGRYVVDHGRALAVAVPPLVTPEQLSRARAVLSSRYHQPTPRQHQHHLLTGLARCGSCGAPIGLAGGKVWRGTAYTYYRCLGRRAPRLGAPRCSLPLIRTDRIDALVWREAIDAIAHADVVERLIARRAAPVDRDAAAKARARLDDLDQLTEALIGQGARGLVSPEIVARQIEDLGRRRKQSEAALRELEAAEQGVRAAADPELIAGTLRQLTAGAERAPRDRRAAILRGLVDTMTIGPTSIAIDLTIAVPTVVTGAMSGRTNVAPVLTVPAGRLTVATAIRRKAA